MPHPEGPWRQSVFDHRQHVKFAWTVLGESPESAPSIIADEIRRFADVHAPGRYHETITQFWVKLVAHTRSAARQENDFETHVSLYPVLLDKGALKNHYSSATLDSPRARSEFLEPDLVPLP
jgi:hypothetical protein